MVRLVIGLCGTGNGGVPRALWPLVFGSGVGLGVLWFRSRLLGLYRARL